MVVQIKLKIIKNVSNKFQISRDCTITPIRAQRYEKPQTSCLTYLNQTVMFHQSKSCSVATFLGCLPKKVAAEHDFAKGCQGFSGKNAKLV